ncbi:glycan metabolism protein RagB [Mucilaginibacter sp. PPCGB 2223]|uniref:RagB/SusD family nutrient uptake outer membrane protein n=1 Tax=Mucilaginibacter sp. PPCGB 2223 TaxID=1886027 RepID=UPI000826DE53|nr:RagB/SusD family nutrient uptake outer membrane protein [Mucilaginibacter sp. PPCGB 2223]OCX53001.1 glycan metabolism protein RagB [Mucilaginibacter sp. PPCGB 2223]
MKTIKKLKTLFVISAILATAVLAGCKKDILDNTNKASLTETTQWASEGNADIFLNDIYNNLPNLYNAPENLDNFTDDNDAGIYYSSWNWKQGILDASSTNYSIWGSSVGPADINRYNWTDAYTTIRKCNTFIQEVNKFHENFSTGWINKRIDEVRFLRAFYYSNLFLHIGGLPIIMSPQYISADSNELYKPRSTYAATLNFLTTSLDTVVNNGYLAVKYNQGDANAGRATLGAALMLKGWLQLNAASPAYNASVPAAGADPHQVAGFGNYDATRWATAAATFKQFITNWGGTQYGLFADPTAIWYEANKYNKEVVFDRQAVANTIGSTFEQYGGPVYVLGTYYTWGNYDPTQELVDQFFMANGKSIADPTSGYDPQHPYVGREPRFYDWIVYDGAPYYMTWMPKTDTIYTRIDKVHPSLNQIDFGSADVGNTGYYFKKKLNPLARPGNGSSSGANFIYFRYAEVLLGYAEAQNEAAGPDASVYSAVNQIRTRAGLPNLTPGLTQAQMRAAIWQERRVELCFENKRFYDIIRWAQAMTVMNVDKHAMQITNSSPTDNKGVWQYQVIPLNHPHTFLQKMYLDPIPLPVIAQNPRLFQNPGY